MENKQKERSREEASPVLSVGVFMCGKSAVS